MLPAAPEPSNDELLKMTIFDLNMPKLPTTVPTSAPTEPPAAADLTVSATQINDLIKLTFDNILSLASVPLEEWMPVQPIAMDTEMNTPTLDQTLTNILEETKTDNVTIVDIVLPVPTMDVVLPAPAMDPSIYLATPTMVPGPLIITTIATARYIPPVRFSTQIISDTQWNALAAALKAYNFLPPPPGMLFPEHCWRDYPQAFQDQIWQLLLQLTTPAPAAPQHLPSVQMAPIVAQSAPLRMAMQLLQQFLWMLNCCSHQAPQPLTLISQTGSV
uniref:Uncharacterized protein n=1 Tax=Romanomermis culicivorax TaxID=13658 RepID=A0A915ICF0_ROMCU